jgi:hypothetical protein
MDISTKLASAFKPIVYEYILNEPIDKVQNKLDAFFNRGLWKSVWDSDYNLSGSFNYDSKTNFKIYPTVGITPNDSQNTYFGTLEPINTDSTKVILKKKSHIAFSIILVIFPFIVFPSIFISSIKPGNSLFLYFETFIGLAFFLFIFFIIRKISTIYDRGLKSGFENILDLD